MMLWLHGGGGTYGRGDDRFAALAVNGVVVVTINYRLGVFGWLSHPALTAESSHHTSGNYGLLDQIAALKSQRRNPALIWRASWVLATAPRRSGSYELHPPTTC